MSDPYKRTNIFYEEGFEEGYKEGYKKGYELEKRLFRQELLAKAKAQGEEAYNFLYNLIHSPNPGQ